MARDLKLMANEAKKRLSSGYFQKTDTEVSLNKKQFHSNGVDYLDEERMYKVVCDIMNSNEVIINPIGRLMDKKYFNSLDYEDKQRYVFKLSEIYIKLKNRYLRDNA